MPIAEDIAKCVMCLPLYAGLSKNDLETIVAQINSAL
jgi:dTDP-4-amino-4,6-dideoxygalactose transaminase